MGSPRQSIGDGVGYVIGRNNRILESAPPDANFRTVRALGEAIVNVLRNAGPQGIRLTDIAKSLSLKINNVSAWMASTGKKTKAYKKLQKGVYAWKG